MQKRIRFLIIPLAFFVIFLTVIFINRHNLFLHTNLKHNIIPTATVTNTPTITDSSTSTITPSPTPTFTPTPKPTIASTPNLEELFAKYAAIYGVDKEELKKIAGCESGFNPNAVSGDYGGLFQFASFAWTEARARLGQNNDLSLRFNTEEAIKTAAHEINVKGTSGWSDCQ